MDKKKQTIRELDYQEAAMQQYYQQQLRLL
jgi:hypothetical protein